eukprot:1195515-Prorocentrum_minimum.AAC.2
MKGVRRLRSKGYVQAFFKYLLERRLQSEVCRPPSLLISARQSIRRRNFCRLLRFFVFAEALLLLFLVIPFFSPFFHAGGPEGLAAAGGI